MTNKEKLQDLLEQAKELSGQVSEDEIKEVVGGKSCYCFLGGGGPSGGVDDICGCVAAGYGAAEPSQGVVNKRCECVLYGTGESKN